jgi:hypothetical protein
MKRRLLLFVIVVIILNIFVAKFGYWKSYHIISSLGLIIAFFPAFIYFEDMSNDSPFFPILCAIYGIYYCLFGIIPFEPYHTVAKASVRSLQIVSIYSLIGILGMILGYYRLRRFHQNHQFNYMRYDFSRNSATIMIIMGLISSFGWIAKFVVKMPIALETPFTLISELLLYAFSVLFYLQLKKRLPKWMMIVNWFIFIPIIVFTSLSTSLFYPILRTILLIVLIYIATLRKIPARAIAFTIMGLIPLFVVKSEFRKIETVSNKNKFSGFGQMTQRVETYSTVIYQITTSSEIGDSFQYGLNSVASRLDLTYVFADIIDYTPSQVPYLGGKTYEGILWKFVPRFLYPDKPTENWGNDFGHRYGWLSPDDDDTSVNMPQMIELYINFGFLGIVIGMAIIGALYATIVNFLFRRKDPFQSITAVFITSGLFNIESNYSIVFGGLLYLLIFFSLIYYVFLKKSLIRYNESIIEL